MEEPEFAPGVQLCDVIFHDSDTELIQSLSNDTEYFGRKLTTDVRVPGRINKLQFRDYWLNVLKPSDLLKDTIINGYKLPFVDNKLPPPSFERNNLSARLDEEFIRAEILRLESLGCVRRVNQRPYIVLPISSVFSKKKRAVIDCSRALNPYLQHRRVRLQDLRDIPEVMKPAMFSFTEDLDSGYWHLSVAEEHRKYLGICIQSETGENMFFEWCVLFLGVKDAVFIFTLLLKPIREHLASKGIPSLCYIDDLWAGGQTEEKCIENRIYTLSVMSQAGFVVSTEKSQGPTQRITYLGLEIDSRTMKFYVPDSKIERFISFVTDLLDKHKVKVRDLAKCLGILQSFIKAIGPITRFKSRCCYAWITEKLLRGKGYNVYYKLDDKCEAELTFWRDNIKHFNGRKFTADETCSPTMMIISDSSQDGSFGYTFGDQYEVLLRRSFTPDERKASSTVRELLALKYIYGSSASDKFRGQKVLHLTDNQAAVSIWQVGSKKPHIQDLATEIFDICREKDIELILEWRSRNNPLLCWADEGSKSFDTSAFSLDFSSFLIVLQFISPASINVDTCANGWNKKAEIFFSRDPDPEAAGINFFAQRLPPHLFYYCFPPPGKITAFILHLAKHSTHGVLIVPFWKSSSFWTNIAPDGNHLCWWAENLLVFKPSGFISDSQIRSTTFKNPVTFEIIVIKFDFSDILRKEKLFDSKVSPDNCINRGCEKCINN